MRAIPIYQVDAFASSQFEGNPAAVCPLPEWIDVALLKAIAAENNLSETAFFVPQTDGAYRLRWFTPTTEVALCGHATLASAHVLFTHLHFPGDTIAFETLSGRLTVARDPNGLRMELPSAPPIAARAPDHVVRAVGGAPSETHTLRSNHGASEYMLVYASQDVVAALTPDVRALGEARANALVTAPGIDVDFVSRFFAPASGIDEDPVTGSTHCALAPYWAERLGRVKLTGRQMSKRGGELQVEHNGERTVLTGACADYMRGEIWLS